MKFLFPRYFPSTEGKYQIAMAGRSTMDMWFRHWNFPTFVNRISVYKKWPIPYKTLGRDGNYFEYFRVEPPHRGAGRDGIAYGDVMYDSLVDQLAERDFHALFFKFCFIDFDDRHVDDPEAVERRFGEICSLVSRVHDFTGNRGMTLLLGTALPSLTPGEYGPELRARFNSWIREYAQKHEDVIEVDLFGPLADPGGLLKREFSADLQEADSHPNQAGFEALDRELFFRIKELG